MNFEVVFGEENLDAVRNGMEEPAEFGAAVRLDDKVLALFYGDEARAYANLFTYFAKSGAVALACELNELLEKNALLRRVIQKLVDSEQDPDGELAKLLQDTALDI